MGLTPRVGHNGLSCSPTYLSRTPPKHGTGPISKALDYTRKESHSSQPRASGALQVRPGITTNMATPLAGLPPKDHERLISFGASVSNDRSTSSKILEGDEESFASASATNVPTSQRVVLNPPPPIPDDAAIDSLVLKLQENVVIRDVAVQAPNMIDVPRGFAVTNDTKPADHYKDRREVKTHVKRKRDEGILLKPSRRPKSAEQYGFRANEINSAGAVFLEDCQLSDLTNNIHPLLARGRFDDTPDAVYDQLVPALRLASMFLTQPICMQFWVTLAFAKRRDDPEMSLKYGKRCQRIDGHVNMTDENVKKVIKQLEDMGKANLIHFAFRHKTGMPQTDIWGCSWPIREYQGSREKDLTRSLIRLHADYYIVAEKLSQLKYPEPSQVLRFSFIFAVIVLHELVGHPFNFRSPARHLTLGRVKTVCLLQLEEINC